MDDEFRTLETMVRMHCRARHAGETPCAECAELLAYAEERLRECPFGAAKPVCERCEVHCYAPEMRERVRAAMRHAGPRMPWRHPLKTMRHLLRKSRGTKS